MSTNPIDVSNKSFTYVVVGGGAAGTDVFYFSQCIRHLTNFVGLAVAARLAEDSLTTVLVIEAGPNAQNDSLVNDPGLSQGIPVKGVYDWEYDTTPQSHARGNVLRLNQGKVLGGSSSINGMCWTRGTVDQYDSFEQLGNPGWNYKSFLPYMKKAEIYHLPTPQQVALGATVDPDVHGLQGKVNAGFPQPYEATISAQNLADSMKAAVPGLADNIDAASGTPNGVQRFQFSIKPGNNSVVTPGGNTRSSSANAYIYPSLQEKANLVVLTGHLATQIVWGKSSGGLSRASGVKFIATPETNGNPGTEFQVKVVREVIVASGAIGSPHFLELSGVGDQKILKAAGVPVNLPAVGTNLQEQALSIAIFSVPPSRPPSEYTIFNAPMTPTVAFVDIKQILGASGAQVEGSKLTSTISQRAKAIVASGGFTNVGGLTKVLKYQANSIVNLNAPVVEISSILTSPSFLGGAPVMGLLYWNLLPQWRGTVHITSKNPSVHPAVDPQFHNGSDLDLFLIGNATRIARKVFNSNPLKDYVGPEMAPGFNALAVNATDAEVQAYALSNFQPTYHPIGSVPMLPREDGGAVGPDLVVYGTSNVRVVDSSIIPVQLSAHLTSTVYGIAEKAADMIKTTARKH
ncbi:hypothetical protein H0H87_003176 [Tephrocybe sp. NHM501043]|nr:hypothetical protein H0H87_003176 [Tephrocybe sp. NHM501043]